MKNNNVKRKLVTIVLVLSLVSVLINPQVQRVVSDGFYYVLSYNINTEARQENFDEDYINPINSRTLVLTTPTIAGNSSDTIPYLFTDENVKQLKNIKGVEFVYPTAGSGQEVFTPGIDYKSANYVSQAYETKGELYSDPEITWDQNIEFTPLDPTPFLTSQEVKVVEDFNGMTEPNPGAYGSIVVPHFPFEVTTNTGIDPYYHLKLLVGNYPKDNSNQILLPEQLAYTICDQKQSCNKVDDLIGTDYELNVSGHLVPSVRIETKISGIYLGNPAYSNVILSYDSTQATNDTLIVNSEMMEKQKSVFSDKLKHDYGSNFSITDPLKERLYTEVLKAISKAQANGEFGSYAQIVVIVADDADTDQVVKQIEDYDSSIYINETE